MDRENRAIFHSMTDLLSVFAPYFDDEDPFPLGGLSSCLLERIVTKVECRSYCRLQQTCKTMKEIAQNQNIRVGFYFEGKINIRQWIKDDNGCNKLEVEIRRKDYTRKVAVIDLESIYGIRFGYLPLPVKLDGPEQFEEFCNILTKYRLSADQLLLTPPASTTEWPDEPDPPQPATIFSKEQCEKLLEIYKPYVFRSDISRGNRGPYEACLQAKQLESIDITVDPHDALEIIRTLITRVSCLRVEITGKWILEPFINCLQEVVKILRYELPQNFESLKIESDSINLTGARIRPERVKKEAAMPFYLRPLEPPIIVLEMQEALPDVILHRDRKSIMPYLWHFYLKNNTEYTRCLVDLEFRRMALHFERGSIFSLAVLPSNLLERIITKLQYVSFFRLQQTCKDIGEIVQVNKNINVYLRKQFKRIFWKDDETGESKLCGQSPDFFEEGRTFHGRILKLNFESIYGVRFPEFPFPEDMDEVKFNEFCDFLKKYRITSSCLSHRGWYSSDAPFTTEQYVKLLNILKPSTVDMSLKDDPNHFEACLQAFHTKNRKVTFSMSYSHTPEMLKRLLFGPMSTVRAHCLLTTGEFYEILISVLEVLRLGPRISSFLFYALIEDEDEPPSVYERDIEEFLMDCESILVPTDDEDVFDFLPFPDGSTGQLILNRPYIVIYWNRNV